MTFNASSFRSLLGSSASRAASSTAASDREMLEICALAPEMAIARLGVTDKGLEAATIAERRLRYGSNEVAKHKKLGFIGEILQRCKNPLVIQLLVIAGVAYALG